MLNNSQVASFHENGFLHIKNFFSQKELAPLITEIELLGGVIFNYSFKLDFEWTDAHEVNKSKLYRLLRYTVELHRLAVCDKSIELIKQLGIKIPSLMKSCNIRMDTPSNSNLFHWHQDTTYLLGSLNAITLWIPLTAVNKERGSIQIVPKTHNSGFFPYEINRTGYNEKTFFSPNDVFLKNEPLHLISPEIVAERGDVICFYQMLLHRSTPNNSRFTRWSVQLRYSDIGDESFKKADFPYGDNTNIMHTNYKEMICRD